jgi:predicted aspartyl protease
MWKQNIPVPPAVTATFIIDTGADTTMVDEQIMRTLALTPTSQTRLLTSTTQGVSQACDVYDVELQILGRAGQPFWTFQPLEVLARPLLNQSTNGMLGRDILDLAVLTYDGPRQEFSLSF